MVFIAPYNVKSVSKRKRRHIQPQNEVINVYLVHSDEELDYTSPDILRTAVENVLHRMHGVISENVAHIECGLIPGRGSECSE